MISFANVQAILAAVKDHSTEMEKIAQDLMQHAFEDYHCGYIAAAKEIQRLITTLESAIKEGY